MTETKYLGVWMDHTNANFMECKDSIETRLVSAETPGLTKKDSGSKVEKQKQNKEQNKLSEYYKKLQANIHFDNIKIVVQEADMMTENQQHAFVKNYFFKH